MGGHEAGHFGSECNNSDRLSDRQLAGRFGLHRRIARNRTRRHRQETSHINLGGHGRGLSSCIRLGERQRLSDCLGRDRCHRSHMSRGRLARGRGCDRSRQRREQRGRRRGRLDHFSERRIGGVVDRLDRGRDCVGRLQFECGAR